MSASLHAALLYRAFGFSILPTRDKYPDSDLLRSISGSSGWKRLRTSPADEPEIAAWYEARPDAGVGIITGRASRIAVADIEANAVECQIARQLLKVRTPTATTPSGGRHVYFATTTPIPTKRRNQWGDLQGDGAYVVAPSGDPSRTWLLGPGETSFAHLDSLLELLRASTPLEEIEPLEEVPLRGTPGQAPCDDDLDGLLDDLQEWDSNPFYVGAMLDLLGIPAVLDEKFRCILPGHAPDRVPSASISAAPRTGHVLYRCWQTNTSYTLCQVYYSVVARRTIETLPWSRLAHVMWKLRTLLETGQVSCPEVGLPAPADLPTSAAKHLPSLRRYFEVRSLSKLGVPGLLVPEFLGPWCGVAPETAKELRHVLRSHGVIQKAGRKEKLADFYIPGDPGSEDRQ